MHPAKKQFSFTCLSTLILKDIKISHLCTLKSNYVLFFHKYSKTKCQMIFKLFFSTEIGNELESPIR